MVSVELAAKLMGKTIYAYDKNAALIRIQIDLGNGCMMHELSVKEARELAHDLLEFVEHYEPSEVDENA